MGTEGEDEVRATADVYQAAGLGTRCSVIVRAPEFGPQV